jgi:sulfite reductase (NADPH) flavoprotein alpha-component
MASMVPFIPDSAPFSPEQRAWLNGYLAGLFSGTPGAAVAPQAQKASLKVPVLYASQSGTGEGLARKVAKELKAKGHIAELASLESFEPAKLAQHEQAILIASTYGEGDPPDAVQGFFAQLQAEGAPRMEKLSYAVLALGDRHYEHFCKFGIDLDQRLESLGAKRIFDRVDCDVEFEAEFQAWKMGVLDRLDAIATGGEPAASNGTAVAGAAVVEAPVERSHVHTRENPLYAPLVDKRPLTHDVSSKLTLHLAFGTADSQLHYEVGDACGVIAQNNPVLVDEVLAAAKFSGSEPVEIDKGKTVTVREALLHHLQFTRLNRKMVQGYATLGDCKPLGGLLVPEQQTHLDKYMYDRGLIDLLDEYPGVLQNPAEMVALLPKLAPRLYSISSSPAAHPGEVHATVAVVRYRAINRQRGGVCSTMMADRVAKGETVPIYIQPNKKFRMPQKTDSPMIMIGPGTGIAPFRAFLHERRATGAKGKNWLFFGERSAATDFLYREELDEMLADGYLARLDTAFSRDQEKKIYVQDRMLAESALLWSWLQDGASVYVCGDAGHMAKDVDTALHTIVSKQGGMDAEAAKDFVQQMKDDRRYQRDVY